MSCVASHSTNFFKDFFFCFCPQHILEKQKNENITIILGRNVADKAIKVALGFISPNHTEKNPFNQTKRNIKRLKNDYWPSINEPGMFTIAASSRNRNRSEGAFPIFLIMYTNHYTFKQQQKKVKSATPMHNSRHNTSKFTVSVQ